MDQTTQNRVYNKLINQLFVNDKWEKRAEAARKLGDIADSKATNLLNRALKKEKDPVVINNIIETMGKIKDPKATMVIVNFLKKELEYPEGKQDKKRLFVIIESLMKIGDKRALEHLGILLNSCHSDIRDLTEQAFNCIDPYWKENVKKSKI